MSRLYDAITKIEAKETKNNNFPEFNKKKPPYTLIAITLIFIIALILSAVIVDNKISHIDKTAAANRTHKITERHTNKKADLPSKTIKNKIRNKQTVTKKFYEKNGKTEIVNRDKQAIVYKKTKSIPVGNKKVGVLKTKERVKKREKQKKLSQYTKNNIKQTDNTAKILENIAEMDDNAAIKAYKKLIKRFPNEISLYNNLSIRYINKQNYKDAEEILKKALNLSNDPYLKINLAITYIKMGKYGTAKKVIETVDLDSINNGKIKMEIENIDDFLDRVKINKNVEQTHIRK